MCSDNCSDRERDDFLTEARILASFNHTNILKLIGVITASQPYIMLLENLPYGDLRAVLKACRTKGVLQKM